MKIWLNKWICCYVILVSSICGCTKPSTVTQYVNIPVAMRIDKPDRPIYLANDNPATYLVKVLEYTKVLEILIEENNNQVNGVINGR